MPLFDFKCSSCGFIEEHYLTSATGTKITNCPKCNNTGSFVRLEVPTSVSISFSGKGWYKDGYQSKN
jgi:putative FmdB family regulatory protein